MTDRRKLLNYRKKLGIRGERAAGKLCRIFGWMILDTNWRSRAGELDLVAHNGKEVVFIEVKTIRWRPGFVPSGNLSNRQRRRNFLAGRLFLKCAGFRNTVGRFELWELVFRGPFLVSLHRNFDYIADILPAGGGV